MYQKKSHGWYKHKDFILLDLLCIFLAFIFAYYIRNHTYISITDNGVYRNAMIFVLFADLVVIILFEVYTGVLRRDYYREFIQVLEQVILIELAAGLYLFTVDDGRAFSRAVLYLTGVVYGVLSYIVRIFWKKHLIRMMAERGEHSLYIVTSSDIAESVVESVRQHNYNRYDINGIIVTDCDMTGKEIAGISVVAASSDAATFICQHWVDEVLINVAEEHTYPQKLYEELLEMGIVVHVNLSRIQKTSGQKQFVEKIGNYTVITTSMNYATDRQALVKRLIDIVGGLVGCILTGIIFIFVGPAIYISSPGPIFFSQTRIGQNGKPFKMYKFRSMYMDAEARKAELMSQNKMSDGRMFKLDFDPRVIGNKILPDGRKKTGIGEFIRKTSLDEFPQFWNVLNGSMSLVGTRPILPDELEQYELHHRARIAIKPGITGMWQVSGRSDITDFEEIVRLDTEYAIVELSRPKRRGKQLKSIITFNFDDLIEQALSNHKIEYTSIWKEGQGYEIDALPIFHVHGFLPNKKDFEEPNLVFSEEAYHSQFIDPYSWSNLTQLNTFSTNVCLFVGLSLSDPNLRRLLDISWRRNQRCKHYIIMKKSSLESRTAEISTMLFEQDANSLGLNVIWCSDFSEIPDILLKIVK